TEPGVEIGKQIRRQKEMKRLVGEEAERGAVAVRRPIEECRVEDAPVAFPLEFLLEEMRLLAFPAVDQAPVARKLDPGECLSDRRFGFHVLKRLHAVSPPRGCGCARNRRRSARRAARSSRKKSRRARS